MKCVSIKVLGKVQGVFFRDSARQMAETLGVTGLARNEPDGSLYIEVEGDEGPVMQFIEWCHEGPAGASVESVDVEDQELKHYNDFVIHSS